MRQLFKKGDKVTITNFNDGKTLIPEMEGVVESSISGGEYEVKINNDIVKCNISSFKEFADLLARHNLWLDGAPGGQQADFSEMDLSYSNLQDANLEEAKLQYSNLTNVDLSYANLTKADLSYTNLKFVDLNYTKLQNANFEEADLTEADIYYAKASEANFASANLADANLGGAELKNATLRLANLTNAELSSADLSYANLKYADLDGTFFCGANLNNANLEEADLYNTNLSDADLTNANLSKAKFKDVNMLNTILHNTDFNYVNLSEVDLTDAILKDINLSETFLQNQQYLNANKDLQKFKKGEIGVRVHSEEQIKQIQTISGIPLHVKLKVSILEGKKDDFNLSYNTKENTLETLDKESALDVLEADVFNKSCALEMLNNTAIKSPLEMYYLVGALTPYEVVKDGHHIAVISQDVGSVEAAEKIYNCSKKAYQKAEDSISLESIIEKTVEAYNNSNITIEELESMHPLDLITNVLENFSSYNLEKEDFELKEPSLF